MIFKLIKQFIKLLMYVVAKILNQHSHYLNAPDSILPELKADRIVRLWHFIPSVIITILIVVKLLPVLSTTYTAELDANSAVIPMTFALCLLPVLVLNGMVIERMLQRKNVNYAIYVKS